MDNQNQDLMRPVRREKTVAQSRYIARFELASEVLCVAVFFIGAAVITGWILDVPILKSFYPGIVSMKVNSALGLIALASSIWLVQPKRRHDPRLRLLSQFLSLAAILIGALTLTEYFLGTDLGIDQLFIRETRPDEYTWFSGRPPHLFAFNLIFTGIAILAVDSDGWKGVSPARLFLFPVAVLSLLTFLGYFYGILNFLSFVRGDTAMAVHSSFAFLLICAATVFARPERGVMALMTSESAGGILARRTLIQSIFVLIVLDYVVNLGHRSGIYDDPRESIIHNTLLLGYFAFVIISTAWVLERSDRVRKEAETTLRESEERFRASFEEAAIGMVMADLDGRIFRANRAMCQMLGYPAEELIGKTIADISHER